MPVYQLLHIKDPNSNGAGTLVETLNKEWLPALEAQGGQLYGLFFGLFGLASNELYWISYLDDADKGCAESVEQSGFTLLDQVNLVATVRPVEYSPPERQGVYVFRWFKVSNRHVDTIAELSKRAWVYFEDDFDSEIQGLFAEADRSTDQGRMVLLTWYKDLSVWQASRAPAEEATELFMQRHALTLEALPVCTRLLVAP